MPTTEKRIITPEQYHACLAPVLPPTTEELFEYERATLAEKQLAPIETFDGFAKRLPASGLFILVPPQPKPVSKLDWNELMARVEWNGTTGQNLLGRRKHLDLTDLAELHAYPTALLDVEDGRAHLHVLSRDSSWAIAREGRQSYTLWHGYVHVILFTMVLLHHYLYTLGSRCDAEAKIVPSLYLSGGWPALSGYGEGNADPKSKWGAPSCGSILTP